MNPLPPNLKVDTLDSAIKLLHQSREGFMKLFNTSPVCMSMTATTLNNRTYARVNKRFVEIFGFSEEEILGRTSIEVGILDIEESARVAELIREKGRLQNDYVRCIAKNGSTVHTISSIEKMDLEGESFLVSFFVDVSKIVEQQAIIEQQLRDLELLNKDLESFSYSVSHDLRAPLRAIAGNVGILNEDHRDKLDADGLQALDAVTRNTKKMSALIDDLLAFSRMGRKEIEKTTIDVNLLVREVLDDITKSTPHKATVNIGDLHPVNGDLALLRQVFMNLLSNAIKYSSKKENPVVDITSERKGDRISYTIRDNGDGFDMKFASRLFGAFQRLHSDKQFEGTGIGLVIAHRIVTRHGGSIIAEAEVGKGAAFTVVMMG